MTDLFEPYDLNGLPLPNRIAMSAMTRTRATEDGVPTDLSLRTDAPLGKPDPATFYGEGPHGYTDYPPLPSAQAA